MAKVMKTAWDESAKLADDASYPHSILGDEYLSDVNNDLADMNDDLDRGLGDEDLEVEEDDDECDCNEDCGKGC